MSTATRPTPTPTLDTPVLLTCPTTSLRDGDVIATHGMVCRLENRAVYPGCRFAQGEDVVAFDGVVLNLDDVLARGLVPASFLFQYGPDARTVVRRDVWRVQGNRRATWQVLQRGPVPTV